MTLPTLFDRASNHDDVLTTNKKPSAATAQIWLALGTEFQQAVTTLLVKLALKLVMVQRQAQSEPTSHQKTAEEAEEEVKESHVTLSN